MTVKINKTCSYCKNKAIIKYGHRYCKKGRVQIYFCKPCNRRFTPKDGFRRMRHEKEIITKCLDMYAKGMSLRGISHHLKMFYGIRLSHVGILYWVQRYGILIKGYTMTLKPKLSDKFYADESALMFNNRKNWLWNLMDSKSRFWIGDTVTLFKSNLDSFKAFNNIRDIPSKPKVISTDGAFAYNIPIKKFFPETEHIRYTKPEDKFEMQIMERLNGNIKQRTKVMRGMNSRRSCQKQMDFYQGYYNFVRPHLSLNNATPADFANIGNLQGNKWESLIVKASEVL